MPSDLSAILHRVKYTARSLDPDAWMQAAAPKATDEEKAALNAQLAALPEDNMRRDSARIRALQQVLAAQGLAGFVVPRADEHMGEYLMPGNERLRWLTGFTGSAGTAVVMQDQAALFIDGRYTIQGPAQTDASVISCRHHLQPPPQDWVAEQLTQGARFGYDPTTFSVREAEKWQKALAAKGATFTPVANPVDALWQDRPADPFSAVFVHDERFAGQSSAEKRQIIATALRATGQDAVILNQLDSIAWLFNMRGGDTPNTPLIQSYAIVAADGHATWFVDTQKFTNGVREALGNAVSVRPLGEFDAALADLGGKAVMLDADTAPMAIWQTLDVAGAKINAVADPCILLKARKNAVQKQGCRAAHLRDGAAMVRFLSWLDAAFAAQPLTELDVEAKLEAFRRQSPLYKGASFDTISAAGPNAALPHYRATPEGNRSLETGTFFLIDSGAQYEDGTTDITRTVPLGVISDRLKHDFTLVLKGHIALSTAKFPKGTVGKQLDALARQFLWREGLNYDHGTGHGVGSYLGVHETAARIATAGEVALEEGMLLSNEPGYYREGSHGIRIENLLFVTPSEHDGFLAFEDVTLCPIDRRAIDAALLDRHERAWINDYHARVWQKLSPLVEGEARNWLEAMTMPL